MEVYYTKKEFTEMKNSLMKENKALKKQVIKLTSKNNELKENLKQLQLDYDTLLDVKAEQEICE